MRVRRALAGVLLLGVAGLAPAPSPAGAVLVDRPSTWTAIQGLDPTSKPAVASYLFETRLDVFARGQDGELRHTYNTNDFRPAEVDWRPWEDLGAPPGGMTSAPAVEAWTDNPVERRLDVFARGADGQLWHTWYDARVSGTTWFPWEPLGGVLTSAPTVTSWEPDRLHVFVRGTDDQLWQRWWDGTQWRPWEPLGGVLVGAPAARSQLVLGPGPTSPGQLEVIVRGTDDAGWLLRWDLDHWVSWTSIGGDLAGDPAAGAGLVVARGPDGRLHAFDPVVGWRHLWDLPAPGGDPAQAGFTIVEGHPLRFTDVLVSLAEADDAIVWAAGIGSP